MRIFPGVPAMKGREVLRLLVIVTLLPFLPGCEGQKGKLKRDVEYVKRQFEAVNHNSMAKLSYFSMIEGGGSLAGYIAANSSPGQALSPIDDQPERPWSLVLGQDDEGRIVIEGYGKELDKPLYREVVPITAEAPD